jgi:hypothetical protein
MAPLKNKDTDCNCDDKLVSEGSPHAKKQQSFWIPWWRLLGELERSGIEEKL